MGSFFNIFKRGLEKSTTKVVRSISGLFSGLKAHDAASFEELENRLISADFGVTAALDVAGTIRDQYERGLLATDADLADAARAAVAEILKKGQRPLHTAPDGQPTVILFVGINGSGKTTTIGKLAARLTGEGKKVMLAACDTFRAAAVEQLQLWGERTHSTVIASRHGADPASVAFDAAQAALARKMDYLLIDTAGRQQNQKNLMEELAKIFRSIGKVYPGAPHEVWLTVDTSQGSNVLSQAREFSACTGVTGLVATKLDGSGKGGMIVALRRELGLPAFYVGLGEAPGDLQPFDAEDYASALFGKEA